MAGVGAGVFMLSPLEIAYVCPGEELTLTCETSENLLGWNITIPHNGYHSLRLVSSSGVPIVPLRVNSTVFNFTRKSDSPLVITLLIRNVTVDLRIFCIEFDAFSMANFLLTTVRVFRTSHIHSKELHDVLQA